MGTAVTTSTNLKFDLVVVAVGLDAFDYLVDASYFAVLERSAHFLSAYTFPYVDFDEPGKTQKSKSYIFILFLPLQKAAA